MTDDPFDTARPRLFALAYRMTGSVSEAEDILQEAWLRWSAAPRSDVAAPGAFLARIVTRLCLDQAKSARARRESYVGIWLPEPLVGAEPGAEAGRMQAEAVSTALLLTLQRLTPAERAAFLLHDIFEMRFDAVAEVLQREAASCRQLATRARKALTACERPRARVPASDGIALARAFWIATRTGDLGALTQLLAEDVALRTDGGGRVPAALNPIDGRDRVMRMFFGLARKQQFRLPDAPLWTRINGGPGFVSLEVGNVLQTTALEMSAGTIAGIYIQRNPEKLRHVARPEAARPPAPPFSAHVVE